MFTKIKNLGKGIKRYMNSKIEAAKEILTNNKNRVIIGTVMIGAGLGLVISGYLKVPA